MEEVFKMYAKSDGNPEVEPAELDPDHEESFDEDDEIGTSTVLTSSDDDEVIAEEIAVVIVETPIAKPAIKKAAKKKKARTLKVDRVAVSLSIQSAGEPTRRLLMDLQDRLPSGCRLLIGGQGAARIRKIEGVERMAGLEVI